MREGAGVKREVKKSYSTSRFGSVSPRALNTRLVGNLILRTSLQVRVLLRYDDIDIIGPTIHSLRRRYRLQ